MFTST